jgi:hypothetical protein
MGAQQCFQSAAQLLITAALSFEKCVTLLRRNLKSLGENSQFAV